MPIIGTAGHVDHGKSTLVATLTGRDPDRWAEEKERGLTIDLGFAWTSLASGIEVGFVDVPGHERFIKNMLAGVGGIGVALFVVAADEGWMPQSEEHLSVLDLLEVRHGVVALTRIDLADDELVELAELEVTERLEGTSLEGAPVVRVAAPEGVGIEELQLELEHAVEAAGAPPDTGRPRLWVDRSFIIDGAGVVVTGTLLDGAIAAGDRLQLWPHADEVRVRGLQSHERSTERVDPGNRAAVNLTGADRTDLARGTMLAGSGQWRATTTVLVDLRPVRSLAGALTNRGAYQLHVGSAVVPIRMRLLESRPVEAGGPPTAAILTSQQPLALTMGDRFILRDTGRQSVVAGGVVLDPHPELRTASARRAAEALRPVIHSPNRADVLLTVRGMTTTEKLAADTAGGSADAAVAVDGNVLSEGAAEELAERLVGVVERYQQENPLRPGIPKAHLIQLGRAPSAVVEAILARAGLVDDGATVRTTDFAGGWGEHQEREWRAARSALLESGLAVPRAGQLGLGTETFHSLVREAKLTRIDDDLVYLPEQVDELERVIRGLPDGFTVAEFRDAAGLTRRQAVPLLEWFDAQGVTKREGDGRVVRR